MITSKAQMLRVMKNCDGADTLTREQCFARADWAGGYLYVR